MTTRPGSDYGTLLDRIRGMFTVGRITRIDDSVSPRLLQVKVRTGETEDAIEEFQPAGLRHKIKGQTVLLRFGGFRRNTMAIATDAGQAGDDYLLDGDVALDDYRGLKIWLSDTGIVIEANGLPVTIKNTPKLRVEGAIEATGEVTAMVDSAPIPLSTHLTKSVTRGSALSDGPQHP